MENIISSEKSILDLLFSDDRSRNSLLDVVRLVDLYSSMNHQYNAPQKLLFPFFKCVVAKNYGYSVCLKNREIVDARSFKKKMGREPSFGDLEEAFFPDRAEDLKELVARVFPILFKANAYFLMKKLIDTFGWQIFDYFRAKIEKEKDEIYQNVDYNYFRSLNFYQLRYEAYKLLQQQVSMENYTLNCFFTQLGIFNHSSYFSKQGIHDDSNYYSNAYIPAYLMFDISNNRSLYKNRDQNYIKDNFEDLEPQKVFLRQKEAEESKAPACFISYSSEDRDLRGEFLERIESDLRKVGLRTIRDTFDLKKKGIESFMEKGISDSKFVVILCTESYLRKSTEPDTGVHFEYKGIKDDMNQMIVANKESEIYKKYFPLILEEAGKKVPESFKEIGVNCKYFNFQDDDGYQEEIKKLILEILDIEDNKRERIGTLARTVDDVESKLCN